MSSTLDVPQDVVKEAGGSKAKSSNGGGSSSFTRSVPVSGKVGSNPPAVRKALFGPLDYNEVMSKSGTYSFGKDDRMTDDLAWYTTKRILALFELHNATEGQIGTFLRAMYGYHTINSGSTLQPGRSTIKCLDNEFEYLHVVILLGKDMRRYFRAYADEVRKENLRILDADPRNEVETQKRDWLMEVAYDRGLQRFPDLSHDSSDACAKLLPAERAAVAGSKRMVLATTINTADSLVAAGRSQGADKYDSTAGTSVEHASGEAGARRE